MWDQWSLLGNQSVLHSALETSTLIHFEHCMFAALIVNTAWPNERKNVLCLPRRCFTCQISITCCAIFNADHHTSFLSTYRRSAPTLSVSCNPTTAPTCWCAAPGPSSQCAPLSTSATEERWADNETLLLSRWHTCKPLCLEFITGRVEKNVCVSQETNVIYSRQKIIRPTCSFTFFIESG